MKKKQMATETRVSCSRCKQTVASCSNSCLQPVSASAMQHDTECIIYVYNTTDCQLALLHGITITSLTFACPVASYGSGWIYGYCAVQKYIQPHTVNP